MSIDHWILVDADAKSVSGKVYNRMICTEIIEELQAKGSSSWGDHSVYIMQGGIEYLYVYKDAALAKADFEEWRRQPLENIRLKINGVTQPSGRLTLQCDGCGKQIPEGHVYVQADDEDTTTDKLKSFCVACYRTPAEKK
jgi:hypothetical protein